MFPSKLGIDQHRSRTNDRTTLEDVTLKGKERPISEYFNRRASTCSSNASISYNMVRVRSEARLVASLDFRGKTNFTIVPNETSSSEELILISTKH